MRIKQTINRMLSMCELSWAIFLGGIQITAALLAVSTVYMLQVESLYQNYSSYMMANTFFELGQVVLIITVLVSAIVEDQK